MAYLWKSYKPHLVWLIFTIISYQGYKILSFYVGYPLKLLIDTIPSYSKWSDGLFVLGLLLWILLVTDMMLRITRFFSIELEKRVRLDISQELIEYILKHSVGYFGKRMSGSVVNRQVGIIQSMTSIIDTIFVYGWLPWLTSVIVSIVIFSSLNPILLGIFVLWMIPFVLVVYLLNIPLEKAAEKFAQKQSSYIGMLSDTISNHATVRLFNGAQTEFGRLQPSFVDTTRAWMNEIKVWEYGQFVRNFCIIVLYLGVYAALIHLYIARIITLGDIAFSVTIISTAAESIKQATMSISEYYGSKGSLKENLVDILEPHEISDPCNSAVLHVLQGKIEIEDITFAYPNKDPIFKNLSLTIPAKQRVGVVGKSGAGKSSLAALLLRLFPTEKWDINIDGQSIFEVTQGSLRDNITYVPQDPYLFHRSVRENIMYGNENASQEDMIHAAKLAQAHDFIMELPQWYDSIVWERGVLLSGGQRQRITIARAFIKNAPILIMDEATSALDSDSEASIQKALQELIKDKTVIVIAHRLSTLLMMDRIIVFDRGAIMEDGAHDELLQSKGIYTNLWERQTGGFIDEEVGKE